MSFESIDFDYRPDTYWPESLNQEQLLARINGQVRRDIARSILRNRGFAALNAFFGRSELPDEERKSWGFEHPSQMGGEYLPSFEASEVEIARISLKSTTSDQISLRARSVPGGIGYRVVDEYETESVLPIPTSVGPLSLRELIRQVDETNHPEGELRAGLLISQWEHLIEWDYDPHEAVDFAWIESAYYPQLGEYYRLCSRRWRAERFLEIRRKRNAERQDIGTSSFHVEPFRPGVR